MTAIQAARPYRAAAGSPRPLPGWGAALSAAVAVGAVALLAVHLLLAHTYWDYSEGVYALTSHQMLHGAGLYTQMAGAQPPGVFLAGTVLLAIHDSLEGLRLAVACLQLLAGLFAARLVFEITASRWAAALTAPLFLLTPWAVHEHGALTPELVALPVLLGAELCVARRRQPVLTGVLCGLLVMIKVPLALPALVLVALSPARRRTAASALATLLAALALTTILAGSSFWREVVVAQTQSGSRTLGMLVGFWGQAGWNVLGLLAAAGLGLYHHRRARDAHALMVAVALAFALIVTFLTNFKVGTGLNITVPVEATLVPIAMCGAAFTFSAGERLLPRLVCGAALLFTLAQSASLIASPHNAVPFLRAGSRPAWGILMPRSQLDAAVAEARRCPAGVPYSGPPLIAFMADRGMPAGQPDQFIITHAATLGGLRRQIEAVTRLCP